MWIADPGRGGPLASGRVPHRSTGLLVAIGFTLLTLWVGLPGVWGQSLPPLVIRAPRAADSLDIRHVLIEGNTQTRPHIIRREIGLEPGDRVAIADTARLLRDITNRVFNTRLFVTTTAEILPLDLDTIPGPRAVLLLVTVRERWYIFPIPILELADRSINEWIYNQGASFRRINYGLRLDVYNVRGRNETARLTLQGGFTRKYELHYSIPYLTGNLRDGLTVIGQYLSVAQVAAESRDNRQFFVQGPGRLAYDRLRFGATYTRRQGFYGYHNLTLEHNRNRIADTVAALNPEYFLDGRTRQRYLRAEYGYVYDKRDIRQYPLRGFYVFGRISRLGVLPTDDISLTSLYAHGAYYLPLGGRWFWAQGVEGCTSRPRRQPYAQTRALGYGQTFVRGYERYVMEGYAFGVAKTTLRYRLGGTTLRLPGAPEGGPGLTGRFGTIPLAIYLKTYADAGYIASEQVPDVNRRLINEPLTGGGLGLDVVTYYDFVMRLEYSLTRQGERGFFFHVQAEL